MSVKEVKLSIIIPVFNSAKTIEKCLKSVIDQTFRDFEIICVDDGSTDDSLEILKRISGYDSRLRYISQVNAGVATARNTGLESSKGEFIGFVDSDDTVECTMFEALVGAIEVDSVDLVVCGTNLIDQSKEKLSSYEETYLNPVIKKKQNVTQSHFYEVNAYLWNKLFRRDLILQKNIRFPDGLWYEDSAFVWCYLMNSELISGVSEKLYNYHRSPQSIMGQTFSKIPKALDHLEVANYVSRYIQYQGKAEIYQKDFVEFTISNFRSSFKYVPIKYKIFCILKLHKVLSDYNFPNRSKLFSSFSVYKQFWLIISHKFFNKIGME